MRDRTDVIQDLAVFAATVDDADDGAVLVDVYGSEHNVCGSVRLVLPDPGRRGDALRLLEQWRRQQTPLTLVIRGAMVSLQNDHSLFRTALA